MKLEVVTKELLKHALYEKVIIFLSIIFVGASSFFTSKLLAEYIEALKDYLPYLILMITSMGLLLFIYIYRKYRHYRPVFPTLDFDFRLLEKEITLEISKNNMIYKKRVTLKLLKNNINEYHDKYHWTGSDVINIKSNIRGQTFQKTIRKNIFQYYSIIFHRSLKKGDTTETELIWSLNDTAGTMVPFISSTIEEPTDLLIFNLSLPEDTTVTEVVCEVSSSLGASKSFETITKPLDRNKKAIWRVENPKLLYHYEMSWSI